MNSATSPARNLFEKKAYEVRTLDDEIRIDGRCEQLLNECYRFLCEKYELCPEEASRLCYGASYFLREYLVPDRRVNLFDIAQEHLRQFAGNWYIVRNMEPNLAELTSILEGVLAAYRYFQHQGLVSADRFEAVRRGCADLDYYRRRIESFWAIADDGYRQWDAECPLNGPKTSQPEEGSDAKLDP